MEYCCQMFDDCHMGCDVSSLVHTNNMFLLLRQVETSLVELNHRSLRTVLFLKKDYSVVEGAY